MRVRSQRAVRLQLNAAHLLLTIPLCAKDLSESPKKWRLNPVSESMAIKTLSDDDGVAVDLYPNHREDEEPLASTWALYVDAKETEDASELRAPEEPQAA